MPNIHQFYRGELDIGLADLALPDQSLSISFQKVKGLAQVLRCRSVCGHPKRCELSASTRHLGIGRHPLAGLTALQTLNLGGTQVSDFSPLEELPNLTFVTLPDGLGWNPQAEPPLKGFRRPVVHNATRSELGLAPDASITEELYGKVTRLELSDELLDDQDLKLVGHLTALLELHLDQTPVSDVSPFAGLAALQTLCLGGTRVSDLSPLSGLPNLIFALLPDLPGWCPRNEPLPEKFRGKSGDPRLPPGTVRLT